MIFIGKGDTRRSIVDTSESEVRYKGVQQKGNTVYLKTLTIFMICFLKAKSVFNTTITKKKPNYYFSIKKNTVTLIAWY